MFNIVDNDINEHINEHIDKHKHVNQHNLNLNHNQRHVNHIDDDHNIRSRQQQLDYVKHDDDFGRGK